MTLVPFGSALHDVLADVAPDAVELDAALDTMAFAADAGPAPYDGLAAAARALAATPPGTARRLVLVTNGLATRGITSPERIVALAESIARDTTSLGVVGFGDDYDARLPTAIGDLGAGTYAYAQSEADLTAALRPEGETTLFPLATGLELRVVPARGYRVGRVYGASRAHADAAGNVATLASPALFIGQRTGSSDVGGFAAVRRRPCQRRRRLRLLIRRTVRRRPCQRRRRRRRSPTGRVAIVTSRTATADTAPH